MQSSKQLKTPLNIPETPISQFYISELKKVISEIETKNLIHRKALIPLYENFAKVLDKVVIIFLDRDISDYRNEKNIKPENLSAKQSAEQLKEYFQSFKSRGWWGIFKGEDKFYTSIVNKYPELKKIINEMCNHFLTNSNQLLGRIAQDEDLLKEQFMKDMKNPKLSRILSTASDLHKQGQQVHILEFTDDQGAKRKIVYKPSSVVIDAMIVGDMERLSQVDDSYQGQQSMIEIINQSAQSQAHQLPTYLVIPRLDGNPNEINNHYGYIEFIQHQPTIDIDLEKLARDNALRGDITYIAQQLYDEQLKSMIKEGEASDYLLSTNEQLDDYSYCCGRLLALMQIVGLTDGHCENLIVHGGKPAIIDVEACFSHQFPTSEEINCFDSENGAFHGNSLQEERFNFLFDIRGMREVSCSLPSSNCVLYLDKDNHKILFCHPNEHKFLEGYKSVLETFSASPDIVLAWFDQPKVKEAFIRILPKSTSEYTSTLAFLAKNGLSKQTYQNAQQSIVEDGAASYRARSMEYLSISKELHAERRLIAYDKEKTVPLPLYCTDMSPNLFDEYHSFNVPYFYMQAGQCELYDAKNDAIRLSKEAVVIQSALASDDEETISSVSQPSSMELTGNVQFFPEPPLVFTRERALTIANNQQLKNSMIEEVTSELRKNTAQELFGRDIALDHTKPGLAL